jgi:exosortase/archaeosortase family protein
MGVLLILVWRKPDEALPALNQNLLPTKWRISLFFAMHLVILSVARYFASHFGSASVTTYTAGAGAFAATKFLVLLPSLVLVSTSAWRQVGRRFLPELIASLLVLATFFPQRAFATAWPWYSQGLGKFVFVIARLFVSHLTYSAASFPTLIGPRLDVTIILACSGIDGIRLFDCLFGLVVLADWNRLNKWRALMSYFVGVGAILIANAMRIVLLVIVGNRISAHWVSRQHINAGWIFFVVVFLSFLSLTYRWMLQHGLVARAGREISETMPQDDSVLVG